MVRDDEWGNVDILSGEIGSLEKKSGVTLVSVSKNVAAQRCDEITVVVGRSDPHEPNALVRVPAMRCKRGGGSSGSCELNR
jgi:hypothetical protein